VELQCCEYGASGLWLRRRIDVPRHAGGNHCLSMADTHTYLVGFSSADLSATPLWLLGQSCLDHHQIHKFTTPMMNTRMQGNWLSGAYAAPIRSSCREEASKSTRAWRLGAMGSLPYRSISHMSVSGVPACEGGTPSIYGGSE